MKSIKDELQHIILEDDRSGHRSALKKVQDFLRRYAQTSVGTQKHKHLKSKEAKVILAFAEQEKLFYNADIAESSFISEGAEQRVYRFDDLHVIKTNATIFYEYWFDYFNSILIHNYFFPATAYTFLGFKVINTEIHAIVKQEFVVTNEPTNLDAVKKFLKFNGFQFKKNNN